MKKSAILLWIFLVVSALPLASFGNNGPEPIVVGKDNCARCGMLVVDGQFGAELVTRQGKILKFDSIECLASQVSKKEKQENIGSLWVVDFAHPGRLIEATQAYYLQSKKLHSPMGLDLAGFARKEEADTLTERYPGQVINWGELLSYVKERWG